MSSQKWCFFQSRPIIPEKRGSEPIFQKRSYLRQKSEFMNFGFGEHTRLAKQFPSEENRRAADFGTRAACAPHPQSVFCGMLVIFLLIVQRKKLSHNHLHH